MSTARLSRCFAIGITIGIAIACTALPDSAGAQMTVLQFHQDNPWTQEVGSVDRYHDSHDYSVQVAADKTLQINLVTRDPNVFFKVTNDTEDEQLVDTYKTGATTWSTQTASAATYTIHVYVDPAAMQRGEEAKYALQIGRYGAEDMKPATTEVTFQGDSPWAQFSGSLDHRGTAHDYTVAVAPGKTLQVNLLTHDPSVHFKVENEAGNQVLVDTATTATTTWSMPVAEPTNLTIHVYADSVALPRGMTAHYALQIGHYATTGAQPGTPVAAGSTAASTMPASAATVSH